MVASNSFSRTANAVRSDTDPVARASASRQEALHDAGLVHRFNDGDEAAFVEIISRYREKMFAIALSVLRNSADAEEVAQDTFIRAHRALGRFRGDSSLATWRHRIALNLSRNRYWYFFRRSRHTTCSLDTAFSEDTSSTLASLIASEAPSPVQEVVTTEFVELVADCMKRLGPGHREILTRRNILNWSYTEIATSFGISVGTVKSRIARARGKLRVLLAKACPEFAPDSTLSEWFTDNRPAGQLEIACA